MNYTVNSLTNYLKTIVDGNMLLKKVAVEGEVSEYNGPNKSGHIFFWLKEGKNTLRCVLFAGNVCNLKFNMENGQKVTAKGRVNIYADQGYYQLVANSIELQGQGELYQKFLELKDALEKKGLFSPEHKKPIPKYIKTLGVVTSPTGDAIKDILRVHKNKNPYVRIILAPAQVQGAGSAQEIAKAIKLLDKYGVDVMIVGRGGGPYNDLISFNEEVVAEAIFACNTPIISAVGHDADNTIADYVADVKAATPTKGAEEALYNYFELVQKLNKYKEELQYVMNNCISTNKKILVDKKQGLREVMGYALDYARQQAVSLESQLSMLHPGRVIAQNKERLSQLKQNIHSCMIHCLEIKKTKLTQTKQAVNSYMVHSINMAKEKLLYYSGGLDAYSPHKRLAQGYSYLTDTAGKNIKTIKDVSIGQKIKLLVSDGSLEAEVKDIKK